MTTDIKEYTATEAALAELEQKYKDIPDCRDKENYERVRKGIAEVRGYRTSLEKMRKELGTEARAHLNKINSEAKRITARLLAIEEPMKAAKRAVDEEKERIKREKAAAEAKRVADIQARIDAMRNAVNC